MKYGIGVFGLRFGVDFRIIGIHRNPGRARGKSGLRALVPLHGSPGVVTALEKHAGPEDLMGKRAFLAPFLISIDAFDITEILRTLKRIVGHAKLLALINIGRALKHMQAGGKHFGGNLPVRGSVVAEAGDGSWLVVVIPEQAVPRFSRKLCLPSGEDLL